MNPWIPLISALAGAIVAGAISLLVHWLSNQRAREDTQLRLAEERARWAIEKRLERIQAFYATIEKMLDRTIQFRIQQAWESTKAKDPSVTIPDWVLSYDKARGDWEEHFGAVSRELLLMDDEVRAEYNKADANWVRWLGSGNREAGVDALQGMEKDLHRFWMWLAEYYRLQFEKRLKGLDHVG